MAPSAVLTTGTAGATLVDGTSSWPMLDPGAEAFGLDPFVMTAQADTCGQTPAVALSLEATAGGFSRTAALASVPVGAGRATDDGPGTDVPLSIPDGTPSGITQTFTIPAEEDAVITDLNVRVHVDHPNVAELSFRLRHTGTGKQVFLKSTAGGGTSEVPVLIFDDEAAEPVGSAPDPAAPAYKPSQSLSAFDGDALAGTWELRVADVFSGDAGTIDAWNLNTAPPDCTISRPVATTGAASEVGREAATLTGVAGRGPGDLPTAYRFAWGETTGYGELTPAQELPAGESGAVFAGVAGLEPSTTYHFRVETLRDGATAVVGEDQAFTTAAAPEPPPEAPPGPPPEPPSGPQQVGPPVLTPAPSQLIRLRGVPRRLRLSRRGRLRLRFLTDPPAAGTASVAVRIPGRRSRRSGRRIRGRTLRLSRPVRFIARSDGRVSVVLRVSRTKRRKLAAAGRSLRAVLTVRAAGTTTRRTFRLVLPGTRAQLRRGGRGRSVTS